MNIEKEKKLSEVEQDISNSITTFSQLSDELPDVAQKSMMGVGQIIKGELSRSRKRFFALYIVLSIVGYIFSLSLCSQNSVALTKFSLDTAAILHQLPDPWCPMVCGWFFSLLPVGSLFIFLDRFQVRRLLRELWWLPAATALVSCLLMAFLPSAFQHEGMHQSHQGIRHTRGDIVWMVWWTIAAVSVPALVALVGRWRLSGGGRNL